MSLDQMSNRGSHPNKFDGGDGGGGGGGGNRGSWSGGGGGGGARVREGGGMRSEVVSRPQSSVVASGGGTFRSAMASTTRAPSFGSGPVRRQGVARVARETAAPYQRPTRASDSVYNRLGERERESLEIQKSHLFLERWFRQVGFILLGHHIRSAASRHATRHSTSNRLLWW